MKNLKTALIAGLFLVGSSAIAQEEELSNVQEYTPSKLLGKGQMDVQLFNNLYTQTKSADASGNVTDNGARSTYFRTFAQALFGTSESGRVNWGFDVVFSSVRNDADPASAAIKVLALESSPNTRTAFSAIGPKIKFSPIKSLPDFSVQSALWVPIAEGSEGTYVASGETTPRPWLDWNRLTSWTQMFYSQNLNSSWQLFYEVDVLARFTMPAGFYQNNQLRGTNVSFPTSFFVNYFSSGRSTVYAMSQYFPTMTPNGGNVDYAHFFQLGAGGKYQLNDHFQLELLFSQFLGAKNSGVGRTYNLGIRYIR